MFTNLRLWTRNEPTRTSLKVEPFSSVSDQSESSANATSSKELSERGSAAPRKKRDSVVIDYPSYIWCVAFLIDGKQLVGGDDDGKIRRWWTDDGGEADVPMDAGSPVYAVAVSRDGRWIVNGTKHGAVQVWNAETGDKTNEIQGHASSVWAVDVSPDATTIVTGSDDATVCVWSLARGERILGPWKHDRDVAAAKFSPDGRFVATATYNRDSVRVYDEDGDRLFDVPIRVGSTRNNSLAWASDGNQLFALSRTGSIHVLDASAGTTLATWNVHSTEEARCIAVASGGAFIVASAGWSVSSWDATTEERIGSVVKLSHGVDCLAISDGHRLAISGHMKVSLRNLRDMFPPDDDVDPTLSQAWDSDVGFQASKFKGKTRGKRDEEPICARERNADDAFEKTNEQLRRELASARRAAEEEKQLLYDKITRLNETIEKLRCDLATLSFEILEKQEMYEKDTMVLQSEIKEWKVSYTAQERELDTARKTLEKLRRNQSESGQLTPSCQTRSPTFNSG